MPQGRSAEAKPDLVADGKTLFAFVNGVLAYQALSIEVFLRRPGTAGDRWPSWMSIFITGLYIPITTLFLPQASHPALAVLWFGFIGMAIVHRFLPNRREHSRYNGRSWLGSNDKKAKGTREWLFLLLLAVLAAPWPGVAGYLLFSSVALAARFSLNQMAEAAVRRSAQDARIDQNYYGRLIDE